MKYQRGQALVIVLLSLAVVLTLVLFILARSTTDIAVSSRSEEAVRAFSAAEAGIEKALVIGQGSGSPVDIGNASYTSQVDSFAEGSNEFIYPWELSSGDTMVVWFATHNADGSLGSTVDPGAAMRVCWGTQQPTDTQKTPAVEVILFYEAVPGNRSSVRIARLTADPIGASRNPANNFGSAPGGCTIAGTAFIYGRNFTFSNLNVVTAGLLFAKVRMFYADTPQPLGVRVSNTFPSQGQDISSTGTAGNSNRKVQVFQGWPEPPGVFDYAIYSGSGLTKD